MKELIKRMRRGIIVVLALLTMLVLLHGAPCSSMAEETADVPATEEKEKFRFSFPAETGAVGFWFPKSGAFAGGLSHTFMRIQHDRFEKVSIDFDGTVAQEVNKEGNTLAGIGIKINLHVMGENETGFSFVPNIGLTALNDFAQWKTASDILANYEIAVYGTILMYKW